MKRFISLLLLLPLVLTACDKAEPTDTEGSDIREETTVETVATTSFPSFLEGIPSSYADIDRQLEMIVELHDIWLTSGDDPNFYYAVTDLDHNGRLEVLYMTEREGLPWLAVYEISPAYDTLDELPFEGEDAIPEFLSNNHYRCYFDGSTYTYIAHDFNDQDDTGNDKINKVAMTLVDGIVYFDIIGYEIVHHEPEYYISYHSAVGTKLDGEEAFFNLADEFYGDQQMNIIYLETLADFQAELEDITHSFKTFLGLEESEYVYENLY